ncbi:MAG: hypothetical protein APR55_07120 [Methanolinea sp. SDB]|nr:MAG: hypothetical protein APR55_07120 [Methanolinea sp. SDB]
MAYCTQADIAEQIPEDELIQLTDDDDLGVIDASAVERAIADADAEIDGYCGKRYSVPFAPVPVMIRKCSVDIAIYNLFPRREGAPESRRTRYKDIIRFLENIAKGVVSLGEKDPDGTPKPTDRPDIQSDRRLFSRRTMRGF